MLYIELIELNLVYSFYYKFSAGLTSVSSKAAVLGKVYFFDLKNFAIPLKIPPCLVSSCLEVFG